MATSPRVLSPVTASVLNTPPPEAPGTAEKPPSAIKRAMAAMKSPFSRSFVGVKDTPAKQAVQAVGAAEDAAAEFWRIAAEAGVPAADVQPGDVPKYSQTELDVAVARAAEAREAEARVLQQALETRERGYERELAELTARLEEFEASHQTQLTAAKCRVAEQDVDLHAARTKLAAAEAALEEGQGRAQELEAEVEAGRRAFAALAAEKEAAEAAAAAEKEAAEQAAAAAEERRVADVQAMREKMRNKATKQFEEAQQQFERTHTALATAKKALKAEVDKRGEAELAAAAAAAEAAAALEAASARAATAEAAAAAAEEQLQGLKQQLQDVKQQLQESQVERAEKTAAASELERQVAAVNEESASIKVRLFDVTQEQSEMRAQLAAAEEKNKELTEMCEELMALAEARSD